MNEKEFYETFMKAMSDVDPNLAKRVQVMKETEELNEATVSALAALKRALSEFDENQKTFGLDTVNAMSKNVSLLMQLGLIISYNVNDIQTRSEHVKQLITELEGGHD